MRAAAIMLYAALSVVVVILAVSVMRTIQELMIVRSEHAEGRKTHNYPDDPE